MRLSPTRCPPQIWFFGGIEEHGASASLALLELPAPGSEDTAWRFRCASVLVCSPCLLPSAPDAAPNAALPPLPSLSRPLTTGRAPPRRIGHSSCVYGGGLWVVGGGSGSDLLRTGEDLADVHRLDISTMVGGGGWGSWISCMLKLHTSLQLGM